MEVGLETKYYEELYYVITGKKITMKELYKVSEKVWNLNRCFNFREIEGFGRSYDYPPARFYEEPIPNGPNEGHLIALEDIEMMLDQFYEARGWDKNGRPTKEKLAELGL